VVNNLFKEGGNKLPKVTKRGIFSEEYDFPEKPDAGLAQKCTLCFAELETTEDEPTAKFSTIFNRKQGMRLPGWKIPCPECGRKVFFLAEKISPKVYQLLNNGPTKSDGESDETSSTPA
jgi:hypothetical protein